MKILLISVTVLIIVLTSSCRSQITGITTTIPPSPPHTSITPSPPNTNEIIEWTPKSEVAFFKGTTATIKGKSFLIYAEPYATNSNIYILDVSNPVNPVILSHLSQNTESISDLKSYGSTLYTISSKGLGIFDISDPYNPQNIHKISAITGFKIEISGHFAYVITDIYSDNKYIYSINALDLSDPLNPIIVGHVNISDIHALRVSSTLLFALSPDGLHIIDISSPTNLKEIGFLSNPLPASTGVPPPGGSTGSSFYDLAIAGKYIYVTSPKGRLFVADISNPSDPHIITDFTMRESCINIIISGNFAYIPSTDFGTVYFGPLATRLAIVDISDPMNLKELGEIDSLRLPRESGSSYVDFIKVDDYLYLSKSSSLLILQLLK